MKAILIAILLITAFTHGADKQPPASPLKIELSATPPTVKVTKLGEELICYPSNPVTVTFTNTSKTPIRILKPLDGSEWLWIMPHYKLIATDDQNHEMPLSSRCGMFGYPYSGTKWPDDYLITIPAGGAYKLCLRPNHLIKTAGTFSLRLQYIFTPKTDQTPGGPYPPDLWRGEATSDTLKMKLWPSQ